MAILDLAAIMRKVRSAGKSSWASAMAKAVTDSFQMMKDYADSLGGLPQVSDGSVYSLTIPAIAGLTRQVVELELTQNTAEKLLVGFWVSSAVDAQIAEMKTQYGSSAFKDGIGYWGVSRTANVSQGGIVYKNMLLQSPGAQMIIVSASYADALRVGTFAGYERYDESSVFPADTQYDLLRSYSSIGLGVLIGWYDATPDTGFVGLDKRVQLESAWLADGKLMLALKNLDVDASSPLTLKVGVFE